MGIEGELVMEYFELGYEWQYLRRALYEANASITFTHNQFTLQMGDWSYEWWDDREPAYAMRRAVNAMEEELRRRNP
jgi:hypothetical protein